MEGQTWGPPGLENLALTLRTAVVMIPSGRRGKKRPERIKGFSRPAQLLERSRGEIERGGALGCEQEIDGHEIFVTSQVSSLSGSGSRQVRSRPPGG